MYQQTLKVDYLNIHNVLFSFFGGGVLGMGPNG